MSKLFIPDGYKSVLDSYDTQNGIGLLKRVFQDELGEKLHLKRVSAPLFVEPSSGLNDDLNGVERPVEFDIKENGKVAQVVHSLAKWKRFALKNYHFYVGNGLYTDMNAIRRDEDLDNIHSIYVDQWDWELVIEEKDRNIEFLKNIVRNIVDAVCDSQQKLMEKYPQLGNRIERNVTFITTQELEDRYPDLTPKERENAAAKEHKTVFLMQIGKKLRSGKRHDGRAPDYDDWDLNGDIIVWNEVLGQAFELSSMGIRVSPESLDRQLTEAGCDSRRELMYHKMLLAGELPYTVGGGIGQSRLCMLILNKAHIGEVHASVWDDETIEGCRKAGIKLL